MVRAYWQSLFETNRAPAVSGLVNFEVKMHFRYLMESNFKCLRYCNSHWKIERVWTTYYPSWLKGALRQAEEAKKKAAKELVNEVVEVTKDGVEVAPQEDCCHCC